MERCKHVEYTSNIQIIEPHLNVISQFFSQARKTPGCQIHLGDRPIQVRI